MTSDLSRVAEVLKVFVISADVDSVHGAQKQRTTTFEAKDHGGESSLS